MEETAGAPAAAVEKGYFEENDFHLENLYISIWVIPGMSWLLRTNANTKFKKVTM